MCGTIITYDCHHRAEENILCRSYDQKVRRAKQAPQRVSFWRQLFCGFQAESSSSVRCTQKPGKRTVFSKCPKCIEQERQERARKMRETEIRVTMAREAHNAQEKQRLQERRRSDRKSAFRCSKCAAERRRPDQMSRAANGGLCCARGIEEFADLEKASGYHPQKPSRNTANELRMPSVSRREQRFPELRYMTSTEKARDDAKAAANSYGWDRRRKRSVDLEPKLVTGYVNAPGAGTNLLGTAPPPPPQPKYEDLGIDYALWRQMQDVKLGAHGRIPPPPERPLPIRPLKLRQRPEHKVPRKPVNSQPIASSRAPPSPISPLSPKSQPRSRGNQALGRESSVINSELHGMLDDAMLDFQPMPEPRYRY